MLGLVEGSSHGRGPGKGFGSPDKCISEGAEDGSGLRNNAAVKINEAKEAQEVFDSSGERIIENGLDMRREGSEASRSNMMAKKVN